MKFLHLADLHLGKRVCEFSMIDDQRAILEQLRALAEKERVDAVLLAGDIYDKPSPSAEAVALFDDFLTVWQTWGWRCSPSAATMTAPSAWPLARG